MMHHCYITIHAPSAIISNIMNFTYRYNNNPNMDMAALVERLKKKHDYKRKRMKREQRKSRNKNGKEQTILRETEADKNIKEEPKVIHTYSTAKESEAQTFAKLSNESPQIRLNSGFNSRLNKKQKSENDTN